MSQISADSSWILWAVECSQYIYSNIHVPYKNTDKCFYMIAKHVQNALIHQQFYDRHILCSRLCLSLKDTQFTHKVSKNIQQLQVVYKTEDSDGRWSAINNIQHNIQPVIWTVQLHVWQWVRCLLQVNSVTTFVLAKLNWSVQERAR